MDGVEKVVAPKTWSPKWLHAYLPAVIILPLAFTLLLHFHDQIDLVALSLSFYTLLFFIISDFELQRVLRLPETDSKTKLRYGTVVWLFGSVAIMTSSWAISLMSPFAASVAVWSVAGLSVAASLCGLLVWGVKDPAWSWMISAEVPLLVRAAMWLFRGVCFGGFLCGFVLYLIRRQ
ncbi:hypothetical protein QJS04_geneDACA023694 [Acorus gramineus]|uniref:Uncharacterized protein n=1 Tax=Acorus gramineus TaxID=55184 RepID=A0AAV9BRA7_ACOGR|nr:hypothetical protein QJS04_geneDACA023694 [Acorus gramineus]